MSNPTELPDLDKAGFETWWDGRGLPEQLQAAFFMVWRAALEHSRAQPEGEAPQAERWTCFHCGESFTDREKAAIHFGKSEHHSPICFVDQVEYRAMEKRMESYNAEDADIHREMYAMRTKHAVALRRQEERGYAKGLAAASLSPLCGAQHAESGKEEVARPRGWLAGTGSDCSEDMYFRLEDAQRECDQYNEFSRAQPDFDESDLRVPEPVYSAAQQAAAPGSDAGGRTLDAEATRAIRRAVRYLEENDCTGPAADLKALLDTPAATSAPGTPEAPKGLDLSRITSVVLQDRGSKSVIVRFGQSMAAATKFLDQFGTLVLSQRAAQLDGGQEGSESNG